MNTQIDPFSQFRIGQAKKEKQQDIPEVSPDAQRIESQEDPFLEFRMKPQESSSFFPEVGRHAARISSRIAETIGGIPGDISSLLQSGALYGLEKLSGRKVPQNVVEEGKRFRLPTSSELKELSERKTKGFTAAQGEHEKLIDEFAQTATSLLGPMKFRKALGVALGSTVAKKGAEISGLGEGSQEATKLGTMFLLSSINPKGAMRYAQNQYEKARALSRGASIKASGLSQSLDALKTSLQEGVSTPSKNAVLKPTEELLSKIKSDKISIHELTSAKRDINTLMGDPQLLSRDKKLLKKLGHYVDSAIKPYERMNPAFGKAYRPANEIYGAVMEGNKAYNFIKKNLGVKSVLGATLGEAAVGHPEYIVPTAAAAASGLGVAKTVDFFSRMAKSPELRKYYGKALVAAAKEDTAALRLYSDKIEEYMEKRQ